MSTLSIILLTVTVIHLLLFLIAAREILINKESNKEQRKLQFLFSAFVPWAGPFITIYVLMSDRLQADADQSYIGKSIDTMRTETWLAAIYGPR